MSDVAAAVLAQLSARGETVATAESLTGGLVCARLVDVPGASAVVRGGVVAYAADLKAVLLDVDRGLLAERGSVDPEVARQMAVGARLRLAATWAVATTGVAGPEPSDGKPVGTVCVAVSGPEASVARQLSLTGTRAEIRDGAVLGALSVLLATLEEQSAASAG